MKLMTGAALLLALAAAAPVQEASAQDIIGGAIVGGAIGGAVGGAVTGRGSGVAAGVAIGAATGALIAAEAQRRRGYYWWRGNCYYRNKAGQYYRVARRKCG
jgi:hypothetical protein